MANSTISRREEELEKKLSQIKSKDEDGRYQALARKLGLPFSDLKALPIDPDALGLIGEEKARLLGLAAILKSGTKLTVAALNPEDKEANKELDKLKAKGFGIEIIVTSPQNISKAWERYKTLKKEEVFEIGAIDIKEADLNDFQAKIRDISDLKNQLAKISATKLLEILIAGALKTNASDIHFEPEQEKIRLRYRLDGVLNDITLVDKESYEKVLNRIKVLSKLKLNIHRSPQDGRFTIRQESIDIEVRVSILPSEFGETIVMRLLDPRTIKSKLEDLGMRPDLLEIIKSQILRSTGAILTTGPTGSGKTTSLYAFIQFLNSSGTKIITIEDPIEYHIKGISQTQITPNKGYDFANGLRAIVRQDPDIILVGEIRDAETADIALQAALTGHLVFSTIHTNDSAGTIPRLIDLGIKPQIVAPAINMAMAQRLLRKLCLNCRIEDKASPELIKKLKENIGPVKERLKIKEVTDGLKVYFPGKCRECNETGYKGRVGVFEAFVISKEIERLILRSPAISEIRDLAQKEGMVTMIQDAYLKLLEGTTSAEEIDRMLA